MSRWAGFNPTRQRSGGMGLLPGKLPGPAPGCGAAMDGLHRCMHMRPPAWIAIHAEHCAQPACDHGRRGLLRCEPPHGRCGLPGPRAEHACLPGQCPGQKRNKGTEGWQWPDSHSCYVLRSQVPTRPHGHLTAGRTFRQTMPTPPLTTPPSTCALQRVGRTAGRPASLARRTRERLASVRCRSDISPSALVLSPLFAGGRTTWVPGQGAGRPLQHVMQRVHLRLCLASAAVGADFLSPTPAAMVPPLQWGRPQDLAFGEKWIDAHAQAGRLRQARCAALCMPCHVSPATCPLPAPAFTQVARQLGIPLVVEEYGGWHPSSSCLPGAAQRQQGGGQVLPAADPLPCLTRPAPPCPLRPAGKEADEGSITSVRDPWFSMVHGALNSSLASGGSLRGSLFWQASGAGRGGDGCRLGRGGCAPAEAALAPCPRLPCSGTAPGALPRAPAPPRATTCTW